MPHAQFLLMHTGKCGCGIPCHDGSGSVTFELIVWCSTCYGGGWRRRDGGIRVGDVSVLCIKKVLVLLLPLPLVDVSLMRTNVVAVGRCAVGAAEDVHAAQANKAT